MSDILPLVSSAALATVLLVDGSAFGRLFAACLLKEAGFAVVEAETAERALEELEESVEAVDVVVTQVGEDGLAFVRQLRERRFQVPVIALSDSPRQERDCLRAGCAGVVPKPLRKDSLASAVSAALTTPRPILSCLFVTDSDVVGSALRHAVVRAHPGAHISIVATAEEASARAVEERSGLVLLDLSSPHSRDAAADLRSRHELAPVVLGVSRSGNADTTGAMLDGVVALPVTLEALAPYVLLCGTQAGSCAHCVADESGVLKKHNAVVAQLFGFAATDVEVRDLRCLFRGWEQSVSLPTFFRIGRRTVRGGTAVLRRGRMSDGSEVAVAVSATPLGRAFALVFEIVSSNVVFLSAGGEGTVRGVEGPCAVMLGRVPEELMGKMLPTVGEKSVLRFSRNGESFPCEARECGERRVAVARVAECEEAELHVSEKGLLDDCNVVFEQLMGASRASLLGLSLASLFLSPPEANGLPTPLVLIDSRKERIALWGIVASGEESGSCEIVLSSRASGEAWLDVGPYRLAKVVGSSATGRAWLGVHRFTRDRVVVKHLRRESFAAASMVFPPLEVEILRSLRHPGICRLREAAVGRDDAFVVLEHIGYGTLLETVGRGLSESTCRAFARDVAGTVAYLHAHGVVHRDLKLENCLVDAEWRVRIVDFGYSCRTEPKALLSTRCGTPHYAAPELFWGKPFAGRPADVWSFGVMVFAMSTGELPFFSPHDTVAVRYAWPRTSQASPQLRDCVAQLLVEEPADRLASHRVLEHPWFN